ncbi:DegV family protein [Collinsella tanakaei]|uniref:DegV family protein n=1 Tax=Collinsella tanakaei TaxID=626935 RepID=UPI0025A45BAC|nr:DegV family protein [Collinsella tanakaei]MDM8245147.1 DegV family protein [Collinsella tanakaei]
MSWAIVADSSCNLRSWKPQAPDTTFVSVPLTIHVGGEEFIDDANLDVAELNRTVAQESQASSSSCPSVGVWAEEFRRADNVIAITISANLSGSYEAANTARTMVLDEFMRDHAGIMTGKNIFILNSRATGGKMELIVELLDRYLTTNPSFDDVVAYLEKLDAASTVVFSLSSFDNLVKNGRMPRLAGSIASKLNIRMLGTASAEGTIKIVGPTRGEKKMYRKTIEVMASDGYHGGLVYIDHVDNEKSASELKAIIEAQWPQAEVHILPCGGLCSYYAEESGLIIGYEWL